MGEFCMGCNKVSSAPSGENGLLNQMSQGMPEPEGHRSRQTTDATMLV